MDNSASMSSSTATVTRQVPQIRLSTQYSIPDVYHKRIDPEWAELWEKHGKYVDRADLVSIHEFRKNPAKYSFTYATHDGPYVHNVQDHQVPVSEPDSEITVRGYSPAGAGPFPVHLNFHGGGWIIGGFKSEAAWCRRVCNETKIKVIDVDYRLAPEYPFPVGTYDCWSAVKWAISNAAMLDIDPSRVSIGGLSAGGQMSAVLAHFARDEGVSLRLQLLIVPAIDMRYCLAESRLDGNNCPYQSAIDLQDAPWGPLSREQWFLKYWVGADKEQARNTMSDWRVTPALAPNFQDLPPAHIITAELDLERDEGEWYGEKLKANGNKVSMKRYLGVPHAFGHFNHPERGLTKSFDFIRDTCAVLRNVHGVDKRSAPIS